ncbi:DUF397 domain-containing protein [Streptomyces kanamyceticus]|uniref:DUF397 domain-containing protein n=1 Tax=Streptomyces kanamyceticus TaxID=1967 RepID=A0A5J6GHJ2_STRKN|nr:DUF397 domain-containing protein [Streptomyces kanamyceticus]QEU93365.1 DUF397 domain-containing protein [Streptomyces kanamyceticus]
MNANEKSTDVAPAGAWFKSSYSSGAEGNCVEVADLCEQVGIRDSKRAHGPALVVPSSAFSAFIASL